MPHRVEFTLDFMSADDAVQDDPRAEVIRILNTIANNLRETDGDPVPIFDLNGNHIGGYYFELEDDDE